MLAKLKILGEIVVAVVEVVFLLTMLLIKDVWKFVNRGWWCDTEMP